MWLSLGALCLSPLLGWLGWWLCQAAVGKPLWSKVLLVFFGFFSIWVFLLTFIVSFFLLMWYLSPESQSLEMDGSFF